MKTANNYFESDDENRARQIVQGAIRAAVGDGYGAETVRGWCEVALAPARDDESSQKKPAPPSEGGASSRGHGDRDCQEPSDPGVLRAVRKTPDPNSEGVAKDDAPEFTADADGGIHFGSQASLLAFINGVFADLQVSELKAQKKRSEEFGKKREEVESYVRERGQVIVEQSYLEEALEAVSEVLERVPAVGDEDWGLHEFAVQAFSRLRLMLLPVTVRRRKEEAEQEEAVGEGVGSADVDLSDGQDPGGAA